MGKHYQHCYFMVKFFEKKIVIKNKNHLMGCKGRWIVVSLRTACSIPWVPEQPMVHIEFQN